MKLGKVFLGLFLLGITLFVQGCADKTLNPMELQLYKYPTVMFPTPDKVTLIKDSSGTPEEIQLSKVDISSLMKVLRTSVDSALSKEKVTKDTWNANRRFALELTFNKPARFELALQNNKTEDFDTNKVLVNLEQKTLLLEVKDQIITFSGLSFNDDFLKFMKDFTKDQGFPLPPAKQGDMAIEQLPLARPGTGKVELLPPAQPRNQGSGGH
ncbi:MAG TPA: hypothetical protein VFF14_03865 [Candidatus Deferrimicrobium sp.]|nr:hypothetical protein [Candidatus Deferrimicrobium sp.]